MRTFVTIGVYGWTLDAWLDALRAADVQLVLDVRQRRGVRGSEYSWANAQRLEAALAAAGLSYEHWKELAPTSELRQLQYAEDDRAGVGKRSRVGLAPEYVERYSREILGQVDLRPIVEGCPRTGLRRLCASSVTPRPAIGRSSPSGSPPSSGSLSRT